jgi:hypothetical protein
MTISFASNYHHLKQLQRSACDFFPQQIKLARFSLMNNRLPFFKNPAEKSGVLVITHPRSGTHLTIDFLRRNFPSLASKKAILARLDELYVPIDVFFLPNASQNDRSRAISGLGRHAVPILKSHWLSPDFKELEPCGYGLSVWIQTSVKIIYVVRSPDKVLASTLVFEEGYRGEISREDRKNWLSEKSRGWVDHVTKWIGQPNVLVLRFEDILDKPVETLAQMENFVGFPSQRANPILPPRLSSKWAGRLARLSSCPPTTEILTEHRPAALSDSFDPESVNCFRTTVAPLCAQLGYEV